MPTETHLCLLDEICYAELTTVKRTLEEFGRAEKDLSRVGTATSTSDYFKVVRSNINGDGSLHRLNGDNELFAALGDEDPLQAVQTAATNSDPLAASEERIGGPRCILAL